MFPATDMTADIKLMLDLPRENWESVLRALEAASVSTPDVVEQVRLRRAFDLIGCALKKNFQAKLLLNSPIEVHSKIPIQLKVMKGDWQ